MPPTPSRKKVNQALLYRWGALGLILPLLIFGWYFYTSGRLGYVQAEKQTEWLKNYVKIVCPRCNRDPELMKNCSLCNGMGYIWVDKTKDFPDEIEIP